jgi:uncharacterized protein YraI
MAATAIATTDVNLRSGPSTRYPAVDVVQGGDRVRVHGCLSNRSWCDVSYDGERGWMSSKYLAYSYRGRRVRGPEVVRIVRPPVVTFSIGAYWDRHYEDESFYEDRWRWRRERDVERCWLPEEELCG